MQINRLFEIVYLLLEKDTITAKELAEQFEVSVRTIYRDIEVLSTANIPIYTNKGKGGGISLLDNFVLNKSILSKEEQNQILFALQSLQKLTWQEDSILEKMGMLFSRQAADWINIDFSNWSVDSEKQKEKFNQIKEAILNTKVLEITYDSSYGEETTRKIEPLQICFKDKSWYLKAYCREKEDYRFFKVSRIKEIKIIEEKFERELPEEIEKENIAIKSIKLQLEIAKEMAYRVYDEFPKEGIEEQEDKFIVTVEYPENEWVYGYILSFGEYAKIVSPAYARTRVKEKLEKSLKNYL